MFIFQESVADIKVPILTLEKVKKKIIFDKLVLGLVHIFIIS